MKHTKTLLCLLLALAMLLCAGCKNTDGVQSTSEPAPESSAPETSAPTEETVAPTEGEAVSYQMGDKIQGIQLGATIVRWDTLDVVDTFLVDIKYDPRYLWSDEAERIHGLSREYLEKNGVSQEDAAVQFANFILKWFGTDDVMCVGHNVIFDIEFLEQLMVPFDIMPKLHITKVDLASIGYTMLGLHKSDDIFSFLGMPQREEHNALEDCIYTSEAIRLIRKMFLDAISANAR